MALGEIKSTSYSIDVKSGDVASFNVSAPLTKRDDLRAVVSFDREELPSLALSIMRALSYPASSRQRGVTDLRSEREAIADFMAQYTTEE